MVSGLLVLVPLWITITVVGMIFRFMASLLGPLVRLLPWRLPAWAEFVISVGVFLLLIYGVGVITTYMLGRRLVSLGETLILKIPVIKTVYAAAKQMVDALSLARGHSFQSVVLVEFPGPGMQMLGFLTGETRDAEGRTWCRVFIPTAPNPTTGFLELIPPERVRRTNLTVEAGLKMLVSGGVIAPDVISAEPMTKVS